jgi:hypothetical protein
MAEGLLLTRRVSERGVHETAQRGGAGAAASLVRHYVGYEEWPESGFLRRETARRGVALILGFGDPIDVYANGAGEESTSVSIGAFVVGNQSGWSFTGIDGHQLGVQVELTPAGALALFRGDVSRLNDAALPLEGAPRTVRPPAVCPRCRPTSSGYAASSRPREVGPASSR